MSRDDTEALDSPDASHYNIPTSAGVAELADAADLKSKGSLPSLPTDQLIELFIASRRDGLSLTTINKSYRLYLKRSAEVIGLNVTGRDILRFIASRPCAGGGKHA